MPILLAKASIGFRIVQRIHEHKQSKGKFGYCRRKVCFNNFGWSDKDVVRRTVRECHNTWKFSVTNDKIIVCLNTKMH